jgi:hypothetical protein
VGVQAIEGRDRIADRLGQVGFDVHFVLWHRVRQRAQESS